MAEVVAQDDGRHLAHAALAQAGLARVALAERDAVAADALSRRAAEQWPQMRGFREERMGAVIARARFAALLARDDRAGARESAERALADSLRFDAPRAESITQARALLEDAAAR